MVVDLRIRMAQDHWLGRFSREHPDLRIEAQRWNQLDEDRSVLDYYIAGGPPGWAAEIRGQPDVFRVVTLAPGADGAIYRVEQRMNPVVQLYRRLGLPLHFPMVAQGGFIRWEVVATRAQLDAILDFFRGRKLEVRIASVRRSATRDPRSELTPAQQRLLHEAVRAGYFAVPRRVTLTELSRLVRRSKSAVSEALAVIERKLLEGSVPMVG